MLFGTAGINEMNHLEIGGCDTVKLVKEFGPFVCMDEHLRETAAYIRYYQDCMLTVK